MASGAGRHTLGRCVAVTAASAVIALALLLPAMAAADPIPEYFSLPEGRTIGGGMAVDSGGDVWLGVNGATSAIVPGLARLIPAQASPGTSNGVDYFPTPAIPSEPCCAKFVRDVAFDPTGGRIWFVNSTGAVGYGVPSLMSPGSSVGMQVATTPEFPDLGGIAIDSYGGAWFTENSAYNRSPYPGNRVAHTDGSLAIEQYPDLWHQTGHTDESRYDAKPAGITIGKEGAAWFAESEAGAAGYRLAKAVNGEYQEHPLAPCDAALPCSGSSGFGPLSVATAPDGSIWFTNLLKNTFGKLDPGTGTMTEYGLSAVDSRLTGGEPRAIRAAPDGTLWLAERSFTAHPMANALVRIVPTDPPTATVYELGAEHAPLSIAPDSNGNVWFGVADVASLVGRLANVVGQATDAGGGSTAGAGGSTAAEPPPGQVVVQAGGLGKAQVGKTHVNGDSVSVEQFCIGSPSDPCALVYLLSTGEYTIGFPGTKPRASTSAAAGKRKVRQIVIGRKSVSIPGNSKSRVVIKLNAKGRKILKRDGVLHATLHASQKLGKGKTKVLATKKITFSAS